MVTLDPTIAGAAVRLVTGRTPLAVDPEDDGFIVDVGTERWSVVPVAVPASLDGILDALLELSEADIVWDPGPRPDAVAVAHGREFHHLNDQRSLAALWPRIAGYVSAADLADLLVAYQASGPRQTVIDERSDWQQFIGPDQASLVPHPSTLVWAEASGERQLDFGSWSIYLGVDPERHGLELYRWRVRAKGERLDWTVEQVARNLPSPFLQPNRGPHG